MSTGALGAAGSRRGLPNLTGTAFESIFAFVSLSLRVNLALLVGTSPLLGALAIVHDPRSAWPILVLLSVACGPAVVAAFACFTRFHAGSDTAVAATFARSYRQDGPRAAMVWGAGALVVTVLAVDLAVLPQNQLGAVLAPLFVTLGAGVLGALPAVLMLAVERPGLRRGAVVRAGGYLSARRWYLSAVNLVILGVLCFAVVRQPMLGLLLAPAPLLFTVWTNTRLVLAPVLDVD